MSAAAPCPLHLSDPASAVETARAAFARLEEWLLAEDTLGLPLHDVEVEQERRGREVMRLQLQAHLEARGTGDVGRAIEVATVNEDGERAVRRQAERRKHRRKIHSIFGEVSVTRTGYYAAETESVHPLDQAAVLPQRTFSYELQRRLVVGGVQGPFDEALERVRESTEVLVSKRSLEDIVRDAATDFDAFYAQRVAASPATTGPIVVAAVDGKGVPMVKPEKALRVVRQGSGKKANKKRMATVAAVFTQQPKPRTPEAVVERLFYEGPRLKRECPERPPGPEAKRVWASLERSKDQVIGDVANEVAARDPDQKKTLALVMDGERALQTRAAAALPRGTEILDLLHVLEKLWKAAYCFNEAGSDEAEAWVREKALRVLQGKVSQVVKGIRQSATKRGLTGKKRETIDSTTGYLYRNRHRMRYHEYLRDGLPIASGSVEGACKNLVKDRMERSGMRWTIPTAEAILKLRAVYLSGDLPEYWKYHISQEQERLHPPGSWRVVEK